MGNSISHLTAKEGRLVQYTTLFGSSVRLNYTNTTYSIRSIDIGRQQILKVYRMSFRFVIAADTVANLNDTLTNVERTLMTRGGRLVMVQDGEVLFDFQPATQSPMPVTQPTSQDGSIRPKLLMDVAQGPVPVSFMNEGIIGLSATAIWVVDITTPSEDAFWIGSALVLGMDAEVTYGIDQNHYTTRTVTGRVHIANFGRNGSSFERDKLSQADCEPIRRLILAGASSTSDQFFAPVRIPPQFIRVGQSFSVDATENVLNFAIVDREVYRLYPAYITDCDARMTVTVSGASAIQYVRHQLSGFVEAPRDVDKMRVLAAAWEIIQDGTPFLTRSVEGRPAYVHSFTFTNHIYRNRIEFALLMYTPFGPFDFMNSLGIGTYRSELFFPPGVGGSAQLFGSGYRLEEVAFRYNKTMETGSKPADTTPAAFQEEGVAANMAEANKLTGKELHFNLKAIANVKSGLVHVRPNSNIGESEAYTATGDDYDFSLILQIATIIPRGSQATMDYYAQFLEDAKNVSDLEVRSHKVMGNATLKSAWGKNDIYRETHRMTCFTKGKLRNQIIQAGGVSMFVRALQQEFAKGEIDSLSAAVKKFVSGMQSTSIYG